MVRVSLLLLLLVCLTCVRSRSNRTITFTVHDLLNTHFPTKVSSDIDLDPCKAEGFYGDIALPNIKYELELETQKLNRHYQEEIIKYQKEAFYEGLQIEEEGLLEVQEARQTHDAQFKKEEVHQVRHHGANSQEVEDNGRWHDEDKLKEEITKDLKFGNLSHKKWKNIGQTRLPFGEEHKYLKAKSNDYSEEFDQVEPKYFPAQEELRQEWRRLDEVEEPQGRTPDTRKTRIYNERQRRIQHTGDPATLETVELEKLANGTLEVTRQPHIRVDMVRDSARVDLVDQHNALLEEKIREANQEEARRVRERTSVIKDETTTSPRRNKRKHLRHGRRKEEGSGRTRRARKKQKKKEEAEAGGTEQQGRAAHRGRSAKRARRKLEVQGLRLRHDKAREDVQKLYKRDETRTRFIAEYQELPVDRPGRRTARAVTARKERVWEHGVIPYEIDGNFSGAHKALFKQAMRHWENSTCVKFVERSSEHPNYIIFTERPCGCCSFVGKRGNGVQAISIGKNCDKFGIVVHELGHVVGFWHEHTRPDRDNHVHIVRENIMGGQEYNFNKLSEDEVNSLGLPYDYDSIMHYARNTFSKGTYLDTIQPIDKSGMKKRPEIGQRIRLSEGDIAQTNLVYRCPKCGRTYQENSASFTSPGWDGGSGSTATEKCEWRVTATHGEKIVLNITELDIYPSEHCRVDYLEVRDGYWTKSPVIGRYCGQNKGLDLVTSTGARLLVTYVATSRMPGFRGFTASYEAICGGEITIEDTEHLESPNFPEDYHPNKECVWKLSVSPKFQIALRFQSFEVENQDNCAYDFVEVRDGHGADSPIIGIYCGFKLPSDVRSTSNKLLIKFVSDGSVQKSGFSASVMKEYDECGTPHHECEHECVNTLGGYECICKIGFELHSDGKHCEDACGGILDAVNGTITSPSFPEPYPRSKKCIWEILAPPQYKITLNFTHFDLEGNNIFYQECEYDKVEVHSKLGDDVLRRHGVFCGARNPPLITSDTNTLRVEFTSDNTVQKSGFAAVYFTDKDECATDNGGCQHECQNTIGSYVCSCHNAFTLHENRHDCKEGGCKDHITTPTGVLQSPNYPDAYPPRKDCVWDFTTTPGHRIKLIFNEFEMEPHQECAYDHIVLYDGDSADAHTLGRFCGSKIPHPIIATGNQMHMVFKSDMSVQRKGFQANHTTVCGGHLQATSRVKHLYSHAKYGDHNYDNRADCDWSIEAAPGRNVHLTFLTFEIEDEQDCGYDFVEVYSGLDASGPSYGQFCGNSNPTDIISVNEALVVRFRSDDSMTFKGFSAAYMAMDPADSDELTDKLFLQDEN